MPNVEHVSNGAIFDDPIPDFKPLFDVEYLRNGTRIGTYAVLNGVILNDLDAIVT